MIKDRKLLSTAACLALGCVVALWVGASLSRDERVAPTAVELMEVAGGLEPESNHARAILTPDVGAGTQASVEQSKQHTIVQVTNESGNPVEGASIVLYLDMAVRRLGNCDRNGELHLDHFIGREGVVTAIVNDMWAERVCLETEADNTIRIRTIRSGRITGVVVMPDGSSAPEGTTVLSWPSAMRAPTRSAVQMGMVGDPSVLAVSTEPDGQFAFEALDPRVKYSLAAGGHGLLTPVPVTQLTPDAQFVRLKLSNIIGARTRLVEIDNKNLAISTVDATVGGVRLRLQLEDPAITKIPDYLVPLSGVLPPDELLPPFTTFMFYGVSDDRLHVGPILGHAALPGYYPRTYSFYAQRVSANSSIQEELVMLEPISSRRGDLEILFEGGQHADGWEFTRRLPIAVVHLVDSPGNKLEFDLGGFSPQRRVIREVPVGNYLLRVASKCSTFSWPSVGEPPASVVITADATSAVVVPTGDVGSIVLTISDVNGLAYSGPAVFVLVGDGRSADTHGTTRSMEIEFDRAPYCLGGLEEGDYRVAARFPLARSALFDGGGAVRLPPGGREEVQLVLASE